MHVTVELCSGRVSENCLFLKINSSKLRPVKERKLENTNVYVVVFLFYVHGKHLRSCRDGQLT